MTAPFRRHAYKAMLWAGCVAGVFVGAPVAAERGLDPDRFALAVVVLLVPALSGARAWFVLRRPDAYSSRGGSALFGGLIVSAVVSVPVLAVAALPYLAFWDAAAVTMLVGLAVTRVGCLAHGCCAGRETTGPLAVRLPDLSRRWRRRYPTQLLEMGFAVVVLTFALAMRRQVPTDGMLFVTVVTLYVGFRTVCAPLRLAQ